MGPSLGTFSPAQAIIAAMITPTLLILASGSLIATVMLRLGRIVDRVRKLSDGGGSLDQTEIERQQQRAVLAQRALTMLFGAIVCFVIGGITIAIDHVTDGRMWWLPVGITLFGMLLIVGGSAMMVAEGRLGFAQVHAEIEAARRHT